jgi:hypothetical protein
MDAGSGEQYACAVEHRERLQQGFALLGGVVLMGLVTTSYVATWAHPIVRVLFEICAAVVIIEWIWRRVLRRKPSRSSD